MSPHATPAQHAASAPASPTPHAISRRKRTLVFASLMTSMFVGSLDQTIVSTALPTIVGELGGVDHMLWVTSAFLVCSTASMPVYGKLGDVRGRKRLFCLCLMLFMAGSVVCGLSGSMAGLIAGRAIQGLGAGGQITLSQAIVADLFPPRERGAYLGAMGSVFGVSAVVGPLLGGLFTETLGWRWCFWINVPLGLFALMTAGICLSHRKRPHASLAGAGPLIPLSLFRNRNYAVCTLAGLLIMTGMMGALAYLPTYLQIVHGLDATAAGYLIVPMTLGIMTTSTASGLVASKTGRTKWMPLAGCAISAAAFLLMARFEVETPLAAVAGALFLLGSGIGLAQQILVLIVQNEFCAAMVGTVTASNNFFRELGATVGASLVGALFTANLTRSLAQFAGALGGTDASSLTPALVLALEPAVRSGVQLAYNDALTPVFLLMAPLLVVALGALALMRERPLATGGERGRQADGQVEAEGEGGGDRGESRGQGLSRSLS